MSKSDILDIATYYRETSTRGVAMAIRDQMHEAFPDLLGDNSLKINVHPNFVGVNVEVRINAAMGKHLKLSDKRSLAMIKKIIATETNLPIRKCQTSDVNIINKAHADASGEAQVFFNWRDVKALRALRH